MNNIGITKLRILGFLDVYDVDIPFVDNIKILIGENGIGKSQILNIINSILTRRFERLITYPFKIVEIYFSDGTDMRLSKEELQTNVYNHSNPLLHEVLKKLGPEKFNILRSELRRGRPIRGEFFRTSIARELSEFGPIENVVDVLRSQFIHKAVDEGNLFNGYYDNVKEKIEAPLKGIQILYFPTFRRVEEDLVNLGIDEERVNLSRDDSKLIQFGMDDVQRRFDQYTSRIDKLSKDGFSQLSGEILSQLVRGGPQVNREFIDKINETDVQIILERIGQQMAPEDKAKIIEMINTKKVQDKGDFLLYFLEKLISIYNEQREYDTQIKDFVRTCNAYLVDKKVFYDESGLRIYVRHEDSNSTLLLSKLSSGEKQIISILSRVYLSPKDHKFIVLFDEPELSLSIFWQRKLLPDIFNSGKCIFLVAVTHSPFIFENELDKYAIGMKEYFTKIPTQ